LQKQTRKAEDEANYKASQVQVGLFESVRKSIRLADTKHLELPIMAGSVCLNALFPRYR